MLYFSPLFITYDKKQQFRQQWAELQLESIKVTKFSAQIQEREWREHGEYLAGDLIVDKEGGPSRPTLELVD